MYFTHFMQMSYLTKYFKIIIMHIDEWIEG